MDISEFSNFFPTRKHHSTVSFFKWFSSAEMPSRTIGSGLKSVVFLCKKQLGFVKGSRTADRRTIVATPLYDLKPSANPYASASLD